MTPPASVSTVALLLLTTLAFPLSVCGRMKSEILTTQNSFYLVDRFAYMKTPTVPDSSSSAPTRRLNDVSVGDGITEADGGGYKFTPDNNNNGEEEEEYKWWNDKANYRLVYSEETLNHGPPRLRKTVVDLKDNGDVLKGRRSLNDNDGGGVYSGVHVNAAKGRSSSNEGEVEIDTDQANDFSSASPTSPTHPPADYLQIYEQVTNPHHTPNPNHQNQNHRNLVSASEDNTGFFSYKMTTYKSSRLSISLYFTSLASYNEQASESVKASDKSCSERIAEATVSTRTWESSTCANPTCTELAPNSYVDNPLIKHDDLVDSGRTYRFRSTSDRYFHIAISHCDDSCLDDGVFNSASADEDTVPWTTTSLVNKCEDGISAVYTFVFKNSLTDGDGDFDRFTHFGADDYGVLIWNASMFALYVLLALLTLVLQSKLMAINKYHSTVKLLVASVLLYVLGLFLTMLHWIKYADNGVGLPVTDQVGESFKLFSEAIFILLLILLAKGWTVVRRKISVTGRSKIASFVTFYFLLIVLYIIWQANTYRVYSQINTYESPPGILLVLLRAFCLAWFNYSCKTTRDNFQGKRRFYLKFTIVFSLYIGLQPLSVWFATALTPINRYLFVLTFGYINTFLGHLALLVMYNPSTRFNRSFPFHGNTSSMLGMYGKTGVKDSFGVNNRRGRGNEGDAVNAGLLTSGVGGSSTAFSNAATTNNTNKLESGNGGVGANKALDILNNVAPQLSSRMSPNGKAMIGGNGKILTALSGGQGARPNSSRYLDTQVIVTNEFDAVHLMSILNISNRIKGGIGEFLEMSCKLDGVLRGVGVDGEPGRFGYDAALEVEGDVYGLGYGLSGGGGGDSGYDGGYTGNNDGVYNDNSIINNNHNHNSSSNNDYNNNNRSNSRSSKSFFGKAAGTPQNRNNNNNSSNGNGIKINTNVDDYSNNSNGNGNEEWRNVSQLKIASSPKVFEMMNRASRNNSDASAIMHVGNSVSSSLIVVSPNKEKVREREREKERERSSSRSNATPKHGSFIKSGSVSPEKMPMYASRGNEFDRDRDRGTPTSSQRDTYLTSSKYHDNSSNSNNKNGEDDGFDVDDGVLQYSASRSNSNAPAPAQDGNGRGRDDRSFSNSNGNGGGSRMRVGSSNNRANVEDRKVSYDERDRDRDYDRDREGDEGTKKKKVGPPPTGKPRTSSKTVKNVNVRDNVRDYNDDNDYYDDDDRGVIGNGNGNDSGKARSVSVSKSRDRGDSKVRERGDSKARDRGDNRARDRDDGDVKIKKKKGRKKRSPSTSNEAEDGKGGEMGDDDSGKGRRGKSSAGDGSGSGDGDGGEESP